MAAFIVQAQPASRFYVNIDGLTQAVFAEASGLSVETNVEDVEEGGQNDMVHRLPARTKLGNLTLKRGLTNSSDFLKWILDGAHGKIVRRNLSLILYKTDGTESLRWDYAKAYPIKWSGPSLKSDDNNTAIESVELAHDGFTIN
jgi:phage tail-like protein